MLERGRTETMALAEDEAARTLADAERLIRAHPELPQAAWLMAEHHQLAALLDEKTRSGGAEELRRRAAVLEPERALAFGQFSSVAPVPDIGGGNETFELTLRGTAPGDSLEWDGIELGFPARVRVGEHHLRVVRANTLVWAGWVTATPREPVFRVGAEPLTCSFAELGGTRSSAERPIPPAGVSCPAWAVLRFEQGRAKLSLCRRSECGAWRLEPLETAERTPGGARLETRFPRWATIALAGAGAALFTTVTLWQTGAFERDERKTTRWSYEGFVLPNAEGD